MTTSDEKIPINNDSTPAEDDHRHRMRFQWNDLMEDIIEDGRRRGLFNDLPGAGKPLDLEHNVYEGSQTLANQIMKTNDIRPVWLSQRLGVSEKIEEFREEVGRTWERYNLALTHAQGDTHRQALTLGWDDICRRWQEHIDKLNKEIDTYNLKRPHGQLELFKLRLLDELKRVGAPRYLV